MSRELMPKSGILQPYVVVSRDAAVVGVSTVDGVAGAVNLTDKYLQKTDAASTYQTKAEGASKDFVLDSIQPVMSGALFREDPWVVNDTPFRSTGANGVESVDMMKVTTDNSIKIGSYASSVQGVEIHSAGRLQVVDQNDSGVETKYPVYSKRYRPEIEDLPFAAIGSYVKDSKGRTIGVNRTGINSDIKQLTQKVTFTQPVTVPDAVGDYDAVTKRWVESSINSKMTEHIAGLNVNVTSTGITVSPGECYIPSEASVLRLEAPKTIAHSGLTAATKYYIYVYKDNGTLGIEVSTTANVKYGYKASNKQSDSSRRFIGMFYFTGGSEVAVCKLIDGECVHLFPWGGIGRVLNLGTATTDAPVNYEKFVPLASFTSVKLAVTNTTTTLASADIAPVGFPYVTNVQPYYCKFLIDMPPSSGGSGVVAYKYTAAPQDSGGFFIDVAGYKYDR